MQITYMTTDISESFIITKEFILLIHLWYQ